MCQLEYVSAEAISKALGLNHYTAKVASELCLEGLSIWNNGCIDFETLARRSRC